MPTNIKIIEKITYVGINGAGKAWPCGLPGGIGGAPPPGLFGIAGAGRPEAGGGGGALEPPDPKEPKNDLWCNTLNFILNKFCYPKNQLGSLMELVSWHHLD